jgi:hypothetical protein
MNLQADFTEGEVLFTELSPKPPDLRKYQGAMFLDRPDLWPTRPKHKKAAAQVGEQQPLFQEGGDT